jgi:putative addiction module killer protein
VAVEVEVKEYVDETGASPFEKWLRGLDARSAAKVAAALYRIEQGNFSNVEGIGAGVFEYKIDFGPGYRVYFGKEGKEVVILVGGGTKKRQSQAIKLAQERWQDYKQRKRRSEVR